MTRRAVKAPRLVCLRAYAARTLVRPSASQYRLGHGDRDLRAHWRPPRSSPALPSVQRQPPPVPFASNAVPAGAEPRIGERDRAPVEHDATRNRDAKPAMVVTVHAHRRRDRAARDQPDCAGHAFQPEAMHAPGDLRPGQRDRWPRHAARRRACACARGLRRVRTEHCGLPPVRHRRAPASHRPWPPRRAGRSRDAASPRRRRWRRRRGCRCRGSFPPAGPRPAVTSCAGSSTCQ